MNSDIIKQVENYISDSFLNTSEKFLYHNIEHTKNVVSAVEEIAKYYKLSDDEFEILLISAWFHDIGYLKNIHNHEHESALIAEDFLKKFDFPQKKITTISRCILATKVGAKPASLLEEILVDADLYKIGTLDHLKYSSLLHQEMCYLQSMDISIKEWINTEIEFLKNHKYFTKYAIEKLEPVKQKNLLNRIQEYNQLSK